MGQLRTANKRHKRAILARTVKAATERRDTAPVQTAEHTEAAS